MRKLRKLRKLRENEGSEENRANGVFSALSDINKLIISPDLSFFLYLILLD